MEDGFAAFERLTTTAELRSVFVVESLGQDQMVTACPRAFNRLTPHFDRGAVLAMSNVKCSYHGSVCLPGL